MRDRQPTTGNELRRIGASVRERSLDGQGLRPLGGKVGSRASSQRRKSTHSGRFTSGSSGAFLEQQPTGDGDRGRLVVMPSIMRLRRGLTVPMVMGVCCLKRVGPLYLQTGQAASGEWDCS